MDSCCNRIVLASASPRRKALLEAACFEVIVRSSGVDETWPGGSIADGAIALAVRKAAAVDAAGEILVAADTVVALEGHLLEKPRDSVDAKRMLNLLQGRGHLVVTGYTVQRGDKQRSGAVCTSVWFRPLSPAEIERYVASGEPLDKAGAYGIQGGGGTLVDRVDGSYTNVIGLPLAEVVAAVRELST